MTKDDIDIQYGPEWGDCTREYHITFKRPVTLEEFIIYILNDTHEWGNIYMFFGERSKKADRVSWYTAWTECDAMLEYRYGKIVGPLRGERMTFEEWKKRFHLVPFDKTIKKITGGGGWSNSDYILSV